MNVVIATISPVTQSPDKAIKAPRFCWLLSPYEARSWKVTDDSKRIWQIDFDWPLPNGSRRTDDDNAHILDPVKRFAVAPNHAEQKSDERRNS
jgi:hypothetical protein